MMSPNADELSALLDREKIRDCLARLARGEDRRDPELIGACFWPDAATDYGIFKGGFAEYLAWVTPGSPAVIATQHVLAQSVIDLDVGSAGVETHVLAYHRADMGHGERDICLAGRYLDRMERRGGEWRIAHRTLIYDWYQDWGRFRRLVAGPVGLALQRAAFHRQDRGRLQRNLLRPSQTGRHAQRVSGVGMKCQPNVLPPAEAVDIPALRERYRHERDRRVVREAANQYIPRDRRVRGGLSG